MATAKAKEPELPLEPIEAPPESVNDIEFEVSVYPEVIGGSVLWQWCLERHTAKPYIGDFTSLRSKYTFGTSAEAEADARRHIERVRHVVGMKLAMPEGYRIKL